jgi:hypothetical protein
LLRLLLVLLTLAGGALFLACGDDDDDAQETTPAEEYTDGAGTATPAENGGDETDAMEDTTVEVSLSEYEIGLDAESGPAGTFAFELANTGEEPHNFAIVETDLDPGDLPTTDAGLFAPTGDDAVLLAQSVGLSAGAGDTLRFELPAGSYVFICTNSTVDGQGHYGEGMHTGFTVE